MFKRLAIAAVLATASVASAPTLAHAEKAPIYTGRFSDVALEGYDTVSYFTIGAPVKGDKSYATRYMGAEFRFSSQENLEAFLADPEAFAPQYGGYCAYAVSQGKTAKGDPEHWSIVDGKLYLNYNRRIQQAWEKDVQGFIDTGDDNWPVVLEWTFN